MAQASDRQQPGDRTGPAPVLRPGRPADARADPGAEAAAAPAAGTGVSPAGADGADPVKASAMAPEAGAESAGETYAAAPETDATLALGRQRRLRRLLRQCERVMLLDFNLLAMPDWPDSFTLSLARRRRDLWLLAVGMAALVFLSGLTGLVPAWIAGGGFGAMVLILLLGFGPLRRQFSGHASYLELVLRRQQLLRDARRHIAHLEGEVGLIWQCNELAEFNPALAATRFSIIKSLSEQRRLAGALTRREHIRLYLIFVLEAEKAYERLQNAYFEGHQQAIDRGWVEVAEAGDKGP